MTNFILNKLFLSHIWSTIYNYIYKSEKKLLPYLWKKCISYNFMIMLLNIYIRLIKNVVFYFFFNTNSNTSFLFTIQKMINPQFEGIIYHGLFGYWWVIYKWINELIWKFLHNFEEELEPFKMTIKMTGFFLFL